MNSLSVRFLPRSSIIFRQSLDLTRRLSTSNMPYIDDPEWKLMLENVKRFDQAPPLGKAEFDKNVRMYNLEKRVDGLESVIRNISSIFQNAAKSNPQLYSEFQKEVQMLPEKS